MSVDLGGGLTVSWGGGGGSGGGTKSLPSLDSSSLLVWDFQKTGAGLAPALGSAATTDAFPSVGTAADVLSAGFSAGVGGGIVVPGPGGKGLIYAVDFYALGGSKGSLQTVANPTKVADNAPLTIEAYFLLTSLITSAQGVILTKYWNPVTFAAPFNGIELNLAVGNDGTIEFGMVDSGDTSTEIGTTAGGRDALTVGYHHVGLVVDQAAKRLRLYVDGYERKNVVFTTGISLGTGPWALGGNPQSTNDSSNIRYSRVAISSAARSAAYMASAAKAWLTV